MTRINKIVKEDKKFQTHMFFLNTVKSITNIYFDSPGASLNDLIAYYVKEAIYSKGFDEDKKLLDGYMNVAILLAFINRITTPFSTPSTLQELFNDENLTNEDIIAECVGLMAKDSFERNSKNIEEYASCIYEYVEKLTAEEDFGVSDDILEPDVSDTPSVLSETKKVLLDDQKSNDNESPVSEDTAIPD